MVIGYQYTITTELCGTTDYTIIQPVETHVDDLYLLFFFSPRN